jgi:hypothetical protein
LDRKTLLIIAAALIFVLIVAAIFVLPVAFALLGFFPGVQSDARVVQSASYWKGARPISILAHSIETNGNAKLMIMNAETEPIILDSIKLGEKTTTIGKTLEPGDTTSITAQANPGQTGSSYDLEVEMAYTIGGSSEHQYGGVKTLIGKYS